MQQVLVVLDTNILLAHLRGSRPSNDLKLLFAESRSRRLRLVVPQVVLDEVINKRHEKAVEAERRLQQARSDLADLGGSIDVPDVNVDEIVTLFRERLAALLSSANVAVRNHPRVGHET